MMELNSQSMFIEVKAIDSLPKQSSMATSDLSSTTSNHSINTSSAVSRVRRVTKGSAIVLTAEKILKYANSTSPITHPIQCTVVTSVARNHDAEARCIQRQWKRFRLEHRNKVNTSMESSLLSQKIFSIVLGWRVRSLMKSDGIQKQLGDVDELYRVLLQVALLATEDDDKSSTVDKRKAITLVQDMISAPNAPWSTNTPTFRSYADRILAETIVKDVLAKRRNIQELLFGDATWRHKGSRSMGYWDLSSAICRLITHASPQKDHLTARSTPTMKSIIVTPKLDVSGMTSPSPAARRYDTAFSNSLELPSSDDLFGICSDVKHEVSPLFLTMLLGESEQSLSGSDATKVLPTVLPLATLEDAHTDLEESDDTVDGAVVPQMSRNGTISVVNHDSNGTGRIGVDSGGLDDEIKQQLTTLRSKAVHGSSLSSYRRRSVVGTSDRDLNDPPSVRQRRASMPTVSYAHPNQSTALHVSSSETSDSMQLEEKRKGGNSKSSILLVILQADHLMPAKKGTIARDKQGNIVPDRKPCLRVSMYLPTTTISTSLGRLGTSLIVDEDDNDEDDDITSRRNSRGTDSRQSNSSSMNSSSSSSFVSRDLRKVHSTHRDFSELTLNPRWGSETSTMDETDTEGGGDGTPWLDDKLRGNTVTKDLQGDGRAVFELSLPCPRKIMQRVAQQYHTDKVVSAPSSSSSSSSYGSGSGSALYDHACNALLEYWSHGIIKIQIVDGERFNEDIFLGEVTLPLSAFLMTPLHQSTSINKIASTTNELSGKGPCSFSSSQPSPGLLHIAGTYPMSKIRPSDRVSGTLTLRAVLRLPEPTYIADVFATATQTGPLYLPLRTTMVSGKDRDRDENSSLTRRSAPVRGRSHSQPSIRSMSSSLLHAYKEEDESLLNGFPHNRSQSIFDADDVDTDNHYNTLHRQHRVDGCDEGASWDEDESEVLEVSFAPSSPKVTESPDRRRFRLRPAVSSFTLHGHHGTPGGGTALDTEGATRCDIAMVKSRIRVRPTSMAVKDDEANAARSLSLSQTPTSSSSSSPTDNYDHNSIPSSPTLVKRKECIESHTTPGTSVVVAPTSGGTPSPSSFSRIPVLSSRKDRELHSNRSPNTAVGCVNSGPGVNATGTLSPGYYYRGSPGTSEKHNHSHSSISSSTASSSRTGGQTNNGHGTNLRRSMMADVSRCLDSLSIAQENADDVLSRLHRRLEERQQQRKISANKGDMTVSVSSTDATTLPTDIDTTTLTCLTGDDCEASSSSVSMTLNNSLLGVVPVSSYHVSV